MKAHLSVAMSVALLGSTPAFASNWGSPPPVPSIHARETLALPPSPCNPGAVRCATPHPIAAVPQGDDALCQQKGNGYWCAPGKLVMCAGGKAKATQSCSDGCNSAAHPPACVMSATGAPNQ